MANEPLRKSLRHEPSQTSPGTIRWIVNPIDLRGIPAIGKDCPGRIAGTKPDQIADRDT